jgi:hypothetical protein
MKALPKQSEISNLVNKIGESKYGKRVFKNFRITKKNLTNKMKVEIPKAMARMKMQMKEVKKLMAATTRKNK